MITRKGLICAAMLAAVGAPAYATTIALAADGSWSSFNIDDQVAPAYGVAWVNTETLSPDYGSLTSFSFAIAPGSVGSLTVVDAGFAGDQFQIKNNGDVLGSTTAVPVTDYTVADNAGFDFDGALANPNFSHGVFVVAAGTYSITGSLIQSVMVDGAPLNSTVGALRLQVEAAAPVPLPGTTLSLLPGLATLALRRRRRV